MAKKKCPEFENHERWLVAFADMMTLLFALFVVLYSIANVEVEKLKSVSQSIQKAFGFNPEMTEGDGYPSGNARTEGVLNKMKGNTNRDSLMTRNRREIVAIIAADMKQVEREINERLYGDKNAPSAAKSSSNQERIVFVNKDAEGIRVTLLARKFFKPSETALSPDSRAVLDSVAEAIRSFGKNVRVEGHTDSLPFNLNGMTNWELSAGRASAVVRYFIERHKYDSQSIYAAGFADTKPISPNDTAENRAMNRRVDLKLLYDVPSDFVPESKDQTPPHE